MNELLKWCWPYDNSKVIALRFVSSRRVVFIIIKMLPVDSTKSHLSERPKFAARSSVLKVPSVCSSHRKLSVHNPWSSRGVKEHATSPSSVLGIGQNHVRLPDHVDLALVALIRTIQTPGTPRFMQASSVVLHSRPRLAKGILRILANQVKGLPRRRGSYTT